MPSSSDKQKEKVELDVEHFELDSTFKPHQTALEVRNKQDAESYRWVRDQPDRLEGMLRQGYEIVGKNDPEATVHGVDPDGKIRAGGKHILMRRKKAINEVHKQKLRERTRALERNPQESFKTKAGRVNVDVVDSTKALLGPPTASIPDSDD